MTTPRRLPLPVLLAGLGLLLSGCIAPRDKSRELSRVAKDWCLTIRASQVIPVYPLTCDLRPGDIFLTTTPICQEVRLFEERGFLPLDLHMKRLDTADSIREFYSTRLADKAEFPGSTDSWADLPGSAFPTYSFEVSRSGGLNLAIPVQGVPIGFGYLGAAAATGTIGLKRAQTVGVDIATLQPLVRDWEQDNRSTLAAYATDPGDPKSVPVFVRVVTRVYRVGEVSVSLNDAARSGAEAAAGFDLPRPDAGAPSASLTAAEQYDAVAERLNASLTPQLGGKVRIISISRRSIAMEEQFDEPMVIGYLAYDYRVLPGGVLSAPVPAYQRLTGASTVSPGVLDSAGLVAAWYTADEPARVPQIKRWMETRLAVPAGQEPPNSVEFLSSPRWDLERRRMIRDLGILGR